MSIKYYLIHCLEHEERMNHINKLINNFDQPIEIFPGVYTKHVSIDNQLEYINAFNKDISFDKRYNFNFYLSGQIGCYLSHLSIIEKIMKQKYNDSEYSVIFEDDVKHEENLHNKIIEITESLKTINYDFDIIYLGNKCSNRGNHIINNVFYMNTEKNCFGTHALLINNRNIEKIYNVVCNIKHEIDNHYRLSAKENELICFTIFPKICKISGKLKSNIKT